MKNDTMSAKDLHLAICSMKKQVEFLLNKGKVYDKLLVELLKHDYYSEDSPPFPSGKELQQKLGMKPAHFKKQLEQIYADVFEASLTDDKIFDFKELKYLFLISGHSKSITITGHIPIRPVVGEGFRMPYFRPFFNLDFFYVSKIEHEFTDKEQTVIVWLETGFYNSYKQFKADKEEIEEDEWRQRRMISESRDYSKSFVVNKKRRTIS